MAGQAIRSTVVLLANPSAGGGRGGLVAETARRELIRRGFDVELATTSSSDDLARRARAAADNRASVLAVAGGDGSVHLAADALACSETVLALLPCGRGNDLARALGIPFDPLAAATLIAQGHTQNIDLGRCADTHFATIATLGFDACAAGMVHRHEVPGHGTVAYGLALVKTLFTYRPIAATLDGDFGRVEGPFFLVASANTRSYGCGLPIAPDARPDDGLLDIVIVAAINRRTVLRILPRLVTGSHVDHPAVTVLRTRELHVDAPSPLPIYADGEPVGMTPARLTVVRRALRVIVPGGALMPAWVTAASPA